MEVIFVDEPLAQISLLEHDLEMHWRKRRERILAVALAIAVVAAVCAACL